METETEAKLAEVLSRKATLEAVAQAEQREREENERKKVAERDAIRQRWNGAKVEIDGAINVVNAKIAGADLLLSSNEKPRDDDQPRLAQLEISLAQSGQSKERRLVFNVSALGLVQPVTLTPHTGPRIADFNIAAADQAKYESVLVEFLDICFATAKAE